MTQNLRCGARTDIDGAVGRQAGPIVLRLVVGLVRYAACHAMWIRQLLSEIGCKHMVREPTRIYGDNQAANKLTKAHFNDISTGNQYIKFYTP